MLKPRELDREACVQMANHAAGDLADRNVAADVGAFGRADAGAGQRDVDDPNPDIGAVRHDKAGTGDLWDETAVTAIFRPVEDAAVGKPRKLGGEHVALAWGRQDGHREAVLKQPGQVAFKADEMST